MTDAFPAMIKEDEIAFRAGKCHWDGKLVTPDKRPGTLSVLQGDDGLMHVRWANRETHHVEDDLIVIQDAYLQRITKCTTGRVYVLKFTSSDRKFLVWMQEPDPSKDKEFIDAFNTKIGATIPPLTTEASSASDEAPARSDVDRAQLTSLVGQFVSQWQQQQQPGAPAAASRVTLGDILKPENLNSILEDESAVEEIRGHLPAGRGSSADEIRQVLRSAQFGEAVRSLSETVSTTDQLPVLLRSMGLDMPTSLPPNADAVGLLVQALLDKAAKDKEGK